MSENLKLKNISRRSSVYDVLDLQPFVVTSPSPIGLIGKSCSIISTYGINGRVCHHAVLYAEDWIVSMS